jgi:hypothetical protein
MLSRTPKNAAGAVSPPDAVVEVLREIRSELRLSTMLLRVVLEEIRAWRGEREIDTHHCPRTVPFLSHSRAKTR